jgi:hypothetical protein
VNCPNCHKENNVSNSFCENCGNALLPPQSAVPTLVSYSDDAAVPPTQVFQTPPSQTADYLSSPTVISGKKANFNQAPPNFDRSAPNLPPPGFNASMPFGAPSGSVPAKSRTGLWIAAGFFVLFLLGGAVVGALILLTKTNATPTQDTNLARETNVAAAPTPDNSNSNTEKSKTKSTAKPTVAPPEGSKNASAKTNAVLRSEPSLSGQKIATLRRGQKIYVTGYSENTDYWNGLEGKWANVQTESGQRGWVFAPLLDF